MLRVRFRRLCLFAIVFVLLAGMIPHEINATSSGSGSKGKYINVVYDDSGSMVSDDGTMITRWSQAKYAMEVFCAMLGEDDIMNIFPMSEKGSKGLTVYGSDPDRVSTIHNMNSRYSTTPFKTVTSAANDLIKADDDYEKWLIVITDGAFESTPTETVQSTLESYNAQGIKVVYLAIGDDAAELKSDTANGLYAEKAKDGSAVLSKVTSIANQIFEHQVLSSKYINTSGNNVSLEIDIPTTQIIVFAQGDNVSVGSLSLNGETITATSVENVKYSDVLPTNYSSAIVDKSLKGVVAIFDSGTEPFESGEFSIKVANATTVEYYYSPGVSVNVGMLYNGTEVKTSDDLYAGEYEVEITFVDPLTGDEVESDLLSAVSFSLVVTNNDVVQTIDAQNGTVTLVEGDVNIAASVELPGNVYLTSTKNYTVLPEPIELKFSYDLPSASYTAATLGDDADTVTVTALNSETGSVISEEEWENTELTVSDNSGITWNVEKGSEAGTWVLTPYSKNGRISGVEPGTISFQVTAEYQIGNQYAYGSDNFSVTVEEYAGSHLKIDISAPSGSYDLNDMSDAESLTVTVYSENLQTGEYELLTGELWNTVELKASSDGRISLDLEKGTDVGTWILTPGYYLGDPLATSNGAVTITISGEGTLGEYSYSGSGTREIELIPLTFLSILKLIWPRLLALAIIIFLLIGYLSKKRICTSRKKVEAVCSYKGTVSKREIKKQPLSVILPYVPEKATIRCNKPDLECRCPNLKIKAVGKKYSFVITNKKLPLDKIKIDGETFTDLKSVKERHFSLNGFEIVTYDAMHHRSTGKFYVTLK
ncbi:MAG: VWA domain-containing protein [Oscillospiraceae bacterium]|nr:VWA domain-containing protein [Oscillospiraceae bacterium]